MLIFRGCTLQSFDIRFEGERPCLPHGTTGFESECSVKDLQEAGDLPSRDTYSPRGRCLSGEEDLPLVNSFYSDSVPCRGPSAYAYGCTRLGGRQGGHGSF